MTHIITLKRRPRWKRFLMLPRLVIGHWRLGVPLVVAWRLAWLSVRSPTRKEPR